MKPTIATCGLVLVGFLVAASYIGIPAAHAGDPGAGGAVLNGDTDCNGTRDITDAILVLNWLFVRGDPPCPLAADQRITALEADLAEREAEIARLEAELLSADAARTTCEDGLRDAEAALVACDAAGVEQATALAAAEERIAQLEAGFERPGCMDPEARNHDPCADLDDGSCEYPGCTDPDAANFDSEANVDDDSCEYPGCTDPEAINFDPAAYVDDGSCEYPGCTDPQAQNFDPAARVDDGSCRFPCVDDCPELPGFTILDVNARRYREYEHDETGIIFVLLPGGEFEMGSPPDEANRRPVEGPVHTVTLSPFLIAKHEVTQAEYSQVMGVNPSWFSGDDLRPVEQVSWIDLQEGDGFLARTGLSLPSEAQWEYAARGGTSTAFSFGDDCGKNACGSCVTADDFMWWSCNAGDSTQAVGGKQSNLFGLHDMHGNVHEWCEDVFDADFYADPEAAGPDPVATADSGVRVYRGGSWLDRAGNCRCAVRLGVLPGNRYTHIGFRPVQRLSP